MKSVHTVDTYLDRPLSSFAEFKDGPTDLLRTVKRDAFTLPAMRLWDRHGAWC